MFGMQLLMSYLLRINKGDGVFMPIVALNKKKDIWGPDADQFK